METPNIKAEDICPAAAEKKWFALRNMRVSFAAPS